MNFEEKFFSSGFSVELEWSEIVLKGPDAKSFLHGQTTNHLINLKENQFQLNSLLGIDGRIESFFLNTCVKDQVFLYVPSDLLEKTVARIEKYQIVEEFKILTTSKKSIYLNFATAIREKYFWGEFWGVHTFLTLSPEKFIPTLNKVDQEIFFSLIGFQSNLIGELLSSTLLSELALDQKKGCYPGQEPISKILNNRGSAYYPALLKLETGIITDKEKLDYGSRTIFKIENKIQYHNQSFLIGKLLRDFRINAKSIYFENQDQLKVMVYLFPFLKLKTQDFLNQLFQMTTQLVLKKEYDQAINHLEVILGIDPEYEDALEIMGVIAAQKNDFPSAIKWMTKLSEVNPNSIMAQTNLSLYHMKLGNIEIAEKHKEEATFLSFKSMTPKVDHLHEEQERKLSMFKKVLEIDNKDTMANLGIGQILLEKNNPAEAKSYLEKVLQVDSKYSQAYLYLGKAFMALNEKEKAKDIFQRGIPIAASKGELMPANEMEILLKDLF